MSTDKGHDGRGATWPLGVLFVVALYGAATALLFPSLLAPDLTGQIPSTSVGLWMLAAAIVSGVLLYYPRFWSWKKGLDLPTIVDKVNKIDAAVTKLQTSLDELTKATATTRGTLGTNVDTIAGQFAAGGAIPGRFDAIDTPLKTLTDVPTTLAAIKAKTDKIKD